VLFEAQDSSNLPELLRRTRSLGLGAANFDWPAMAIEDARSALADLLRGGDVVLFGDHARELSTDEAIRAIRSKAAWTQGMPGEADYYEIGITDNGLRTYASILPRFWPAGVADK
jgi:hypothetical protein